VQLTEIAGIEKPADQVGWDLLGAERGKLVRRCKLKASIGVGQRSLETSVEKPCDSITTTPAARPSEWR
jgi:hypothetical protein